MKLALVNLRQKWKFRADVKFEAGMLCVERAQAALEAGSIKDYHVLYCEDDPDIVHTVLIDGNG